MKSIVIKSGKICVKYKKIDTCRLKTLIIRLLQEPAGYLRQLASLSFREVHMLEQLLSCHLFAEVRQPVGIHVQVRLVYLENITGEDYLGIFPGPCDDGLDLVRREVLRFIHYEEHPSKTSSTDVGQRRDQKLLFLEHLVYFGGLLASRFETMPDDVQVVHERLDERSHLALLVTWQEAYVLIAEDDRRPGQYDLPEIPFLFKGGGKRKQCLSGTCSTGQ